MNNNISIKEHIDDVLSDIKISDELLQEILNVSCKKGSIKFSIKKCIIAVAAIIVISLGSFTALAATIPEINDFLYSLYPQIADLLMPMNQSVTDNNMKIELISAINDGYSSIIYMAVSGDKNVDVEEIALRYSISNRTATYVKSLMYDEKTGTKYLMITSLNSYEEDKNENLSIDEITSYGNINISEEDMNFKLSDIISKQYEFMNENEFVNTNRSYNSITGYKKIEALRPWDNPMSIHPDLDEYALLSNAAVIDGKLHIQWLPQKKQDFVFVSLYLADKINKSIVKHEASRKSYVKYGDSDNIEYNEVIIDLDGKDVSEYSLNFSVTFEKPIATGEWEFAMKYRNCQDKTLRLIPSKEIADEIIITPIAIYCRNIRCKAEELTYEIELTDGTKINSKNTGLLGSGFLSKIPGLIYRPFFDIFKVEPNEYMDTANIKKVTICGEVLYNG